jgi:hypothetical protein
MFNEFGSIYQLAISYMVPLNINIFWNFGVLGFFFYFFMLNYKHIKKLLLFNNSNKDSKGKCNYNAGYIDWFFWGVAAVFWLAVWIASIIWGSLIVDFVLIYVNNLKINNLIIDFFNTKVYICQKKYFIIENIDYFKNKKKDENLKILINHYILENYFVFNNNYNNIKIILLNERDVTLFFKNILKIIFLNLESILIVSQKLIYDYVNYIKPLYNWYGNYSLLINKRVINTNLENLYYNIKFDLLLDIQNENTKSLVWFLENFNHKMKQHTFIQIFNNFNKLFKRKSYNTLQGYQSLILVYYKSPKKFAAPSLWNQIDELLGSRSNYQSSVPLYARRRIPEMVFTLLYKTLPRTNIFTYGLESDLNLNIRTSNKFNLNWNIYSTYILKNNNQNEAILNKKMINFDQNFNEITYNEWKKIFWYHKDQMFIYHFFEPMYSEDYFVKKFFGPSYSSEAFEEKKSRLLKFINKYFNITLVPLQEDFNEENGLLIKKYKNAKISTHNDHRIDSYKKINLKNTDLAYSKSYNNYSYWWSWHQDFVELNGDLSHLNKIPIGKYKASVRKYFFVSDTYINSFDINAIINNVNNKNYLFHQKKIGDMGHLSSADMDYFFTDPETSIFNKRLEWKPRKEEAPSKKEALSPLMQIFENKTKKINLDDIDIQNMPDSTWSEIFSSRKNNKNFERKFKPFLEEIGAYKELYPEPPQTKRGVLFDHIKPITKVSKWMNKHNKWYLYDKNEVRDRIIKIIRDPKILNEYLNDLEKLQKKREFLALTNKVSLYRQEKESPLYEKYKKLDPLNLTGKVRSSKGMLIQWGYKTQYKTYIMKQKEEWKTFFVDYKINTPWRKATRYFRWERKYINRGHKAEPTWNMDSRQVLRKKNNIQNFQIPMHGYKAILMERELLKNVLVGNDVLEYARKENLLDAQSRFGDRTGAYKPRFIYTYFKNLGKIDYYMGYEEDIYNFYNLRIGRPFKWKAYEIQESVMRGKGRYEAEYWNYDLLKEKKKYEDFRDFVYKNNLNKFIDTNTYHRIAYIYKKNTLKNIMPFTRIWNDNDINKPNVKYFKKFYHYLKSKTKLIPLSKKIFENSLNSLGGSWTKKYMFDSLFNNIKLYKKKWKNDIRYVLYTNRRYFGIFKFKYYS